MDKNAFKEGFIEGLAERGHTLQELEEGLEKMANIPLMMGGLGIAALLALGGARFAARMGGRAAAKLTEPTSEDIEAAKREEILGKYKTLTLKARQRALEQQPTVPTI